MNGRGPLINWESALLLHLLLAADPSQAIVGTGLQLDIPAAMKPQVVLQESGYVVFGASGNCPVGVEVYTEQAKDRPKDLNAFGRLLETDHTKPFTLVEPLERGRMEKRDVLRAAPRSSKGTLQRQVAFFIGSTGARPSKRRFRSR